MDGASNVVSESNIESTTRNNIDSATITDNMDSTSNVTSGNTSNMDRTSNLPPVGVSNTEYEKAISDLMKNLDLAKERGDNYCEMKAYLGLGNVYEITQQYDEAVCHAKECIRIIQEISVKKATEMNDDHDSLLVAGIYVKDANLGPAAATAYFTLGRSEAHLQLFEDSLDSFQKCAAIATEIGDEMAKVMSCYGITKLYEAKDQWHDVIEFSRKYIDKMSLFCDKELQIEAYLRLATAFFHTDSHKEAVVYSKKCIETLEESPDVNGCSKYISALSVLVQSYSALDNYDETISYGKKYLKISKNTGNKEAEMQAHYLLASAYDQLHHIDLTYNHANEGMAIAKELKDSTVIERFRLLLSGFFALVGKKEEAFSLNPGIKTMFEVPACLRQELEVLVKAVKEGDVGQQLVFQFRLNNYYKSKHQYELALNCLKQAMELIPNGHEFKVFHYATIAEMYIAMKKYKEGLEYCEAGLREVATCKNKKNLFDFFFYISQLYAANNNWQLAEEYIEEAEQCFETLYGFIGSNEEIKMSMIDNYGKCLRFLSLVYLQTNQKEESLLVLDKCRARVLKDILVVNYGMQENKEASDMKFSDIEALVSNNQFAILYYSICGFGNALAFLVGHNCFEASAQQLFFDEEKYHQLIDKMFDEIEVLEELNCEDRTLDTEQDTKLQKQEEEEDDGRKLLMVQLPKRNFSVYKKTILMEHEGKQRLATVLEFLYYLIIGEGQSLIKESEIIFIPDGSHCKIPFAALQDPSTGKYLSETKRIRLAPSITTLKLLLSANTAEYHSNGGALIIGDPGVGKVMLNGKVTELLRLKSAQKEANIVARNLGVEPLVGEEATKPVVLEKLQQGVSVVHVAAHGSLTKGTIALAPSPEIRETKPIPDEEDYMLTMADVQQAKVRAQLVVLSCCHSGRGEIRAEGVVGMCRAFLASGARAVVASLWAIDDEATLEFMVIFYGHLKNGKSASTSLQLTMNEMRSIDEYKEPKYWAPFFLMGDDVTLKFT